MITLLCSVEDDLHPTLVYLFDRARATWVLDVICLEEDGGAVLEDSNRLFVLCHCGAFTEPAVALIDSILESDGHWLGSVRLDEGRDQAMDAFSDCLWSAMRRRTMRAGVR